MTSRTLAQSLWVSFCLSSGLLAQSLSNWLA